MQEFNGGRHLSRSGAEKSVSILGALTGPCKRIHGKEDKGRGSPTRAWEELSSPHMPALDGGTLGQSHRSGKGAAEQGLETGSFLVLHASHLLVCDLLVTGLLVASDGKTQLRQKQRR